jgi:hypothetical protein
MHLPNYLHENRSRQCFERIATRARPGEDGIDKAYRWIYTSCTKQNSRTSTCIDNIDLPCSEAAVANPD